MILESAINQQPPERADYSDAVGRTESVKEHIAVERVQALAKTLDLDKVPNIGDPLPSGWHWLFFNPFVRQRDLGHDGHPKRGGFLPPVTLPRRMWAGSRIAYHVAISIGEEVTRDSEIIKVANKTGKTGSLVFITVRHTIRRDENVAMVEEQDIVYREAAMLDTSTSRTQAAPSDAAFSETIVPNSTLLFRYSALTSNGHRIHYDRPYAQGEEGYRDLVVHGPLTATLLQGFSRRCRPEKRLIGFEFRGMAPLFVDQPFDLQAVSGKSADILDVWARGPEGELAMRAEAHFDA